MELLCCVSAMGRRWAGEMVTSIYVAGKSDCGK